MNGISLSLHKGYSAEKATTGNNSWVAFPYLSGATRSKRPLPDSLPLGMELVLEHVVKKTKLDPQLSSVTLKGVEGASIYCVVVDSKWEPGEGVEEFLIGLRERLPVQTSLAVRMENGLDHSVAFGLIPLVEYAMVAPGWDELSTELSELGVTLLHDTLTQTNEIAVNGQVYSVEGTEPGTIEGDGFVINYRFDE